MTIEFHCPHCDKFLKTPDDKAGVRANCPGCGQFITIPDPVHEAAQIDSSFAGVSAEAVTPPADDAPDPEDHEIIETEGSGSSSQHGLKPCPMCGATIKKSATHCRFCGETIVRGAKPGAWEPTRIDAGGVLAIAWETYTNQFGILIGASLIWAAILFGMYVVSMVLFQVVTITFVGVAGNGGPANFALFGFGIMALAFFLFILDVAIFLYLESGMALLWLRVARGENAEISNLFGGLRYFWRFLGVALIIGAISFAAYLIAILPMLIFQNALLGLATAIPVFLVSIIVSLRFWPLPFVIVDRDAGIIQALQDCPRATANNSLAVLVLALAGIGVYLLGVLACFIGVLAAVPLIRLFFAVAYCGMTGQVALRRE